MFIYNWFVSAISFDSSERCIVVNNKICIHANRKWDEKNKIIRAGLKAINYLAHCKGQHDYDFLYTNGDGKVIKLFLCPDAVEEELCNWNLAAKISRSSKYKKLKYKKIFDDDTDWTW